jgi:hypothetical protein
MLRQRDDPSDASGAAALAPEEEGPAGSRNGGVAGRIEVGLARHGGVEADTTCRTWQRPVFVPYSVPLFT